MKKGGRYTTLPLSEALLVTKDGYVPRPHNRTELIPRWKKEVQLAFFLFIMALAVGIVMIGLGFYLGVPSDTNGVLALMFGAAFCLPASVILGLIALRKWNLYNTHFALVLFEHGFFTGEAGKEDVKQGKVPFTPWSDVMSVTCTDEFEIQTEIYGNKGKLEEFLRSESAVHLFNVRLKRENRSMKVMLTKDQGKAARLFVELVPGGCSHGVEAVAGTLKVNGKGGKKR